MTTTIITGHRGSGKTFIAETLSKTVQASVKTALNQEQFDAIIKTQQDTHAYIVCDEFIPIIVIRPDRVFYTINTARLR